MDFPKLIKVRQSFPTNQLTDIERTVRQEIDRVGLLITPGAHIAITVGSRGIANLDRIVRATVDAVKARSASPFIIPAMGSHGGATAAGQTDVLAGYGITEAAVGAPVRSSMEVVELPQGSIGHKLYQDKLAYEADGIIVLNRVKVHTDFHGNTESGLLKMCVIGLGKHKQALAVHRYGVHGIRDLLPAAAEQIIRSSKIILGLGIVENAYDQTSVIRAVLPQEMRQEEMKLLDICRQNMPKLPIDQLNLLIVDQMGKEISGSGMDTNIIGRMAIRGEPEPVVPDIRTLVVTDLSAATHGNASGMGLADFITKRLQEKIDFQATYENILTSTFSERGKMPIVAETDRQAVGFAMRTWGPVDPEDAAIARIRDTLHLEYLYVSRPVLNQCAQLEQLGDEQEQFDADGTLRPF
ncbi:MAG: DUF362 domain-containing protein [Bacillota bacterium]|nr:DUF362 domain-containing protein [Bacillota bacterium]